MKLGILGTGKIVQEFLPWLVEHTPFTVQAICSTRARRQRPQSCVHNIRVPQHTTNYFGTAAVGGRGVHRRAQLTACALRPRGAGGGKQVIVEKPMAVTAAETEELAALAQRKRLFLFEAMTTQYQPTTPNSGSCCPGGHGTHGTVQLQPVFQPV